MEIEPYIKEINTTHESMAIENENTENTGDPHKLRKEHYVTSGHTYRVVVTASVKDGTKFLKDTSAQGYILS